MSESEKPEKNDGVTVVSGGVSVPDDGDNALLKIDSPAGRKFLRTLANGFGAVGPALRARMGTRGIRKIGDAKADYIRKVAQAEKEAIDLLGPKRALEIVAEADAVNSIRERTDARLNFQEEKRQHNIESVAWQAAHKLPENASEEEVNPDWIARFFESVKDVSDETMQSLWSSALAGEVATPGQTSLRTLDVLKNLSQQDAQEFERVLQFSMSGAGVFYPINADKRDIAQRILPYSRKIHMEECGLIHHEPNLRVEFNNSKVQRFTIGLFIFGIYPMPPHDAFNVMIPEFAISSVGREIAQFVPAQFSELWYIRELAKHFANDKVILRLESSLAPKAVNPRWSAVHVAPPLAGDEANISPTATDEELQAMLENCPRRIVTVE